MGLCPACWMSKNQLRLRLPLNASLQTGVIYPDCPVTEGANGDWAVRPERPHLELRLVSVWRPR